MTTVLEVVLDSRTEPFSAPAPNGRKWDALQWRPDANEPDVSCYMRNWGDLIEFEVGIGQCSIVPGQPSKPAVGNTVSIDPGAGYGIVWELDRVHPTWFPIGREFIRRGVLVPLARRDLIPKANRLARGVFSSDWAHDRMFYGPAEMPLPNLGQQQAVQIASIDAQRLAGLRAALQTGMPYHVDDLEDGPVLIVNGGWRPWGPSNPGAPAGSGIYFPTGWRQNSSDLQLAVLGWECEHERMKRYYHRATGKPLCVDDYPGPGTSPDLWGGPLPETVGIPNYDPIPPPYDFAHEIRGTRRTIQVAEQADYPMAWRSIQGVAALARMRFSERGRLPSPGYHPLNIASLLQEARAKPSTGIWGSGPGRNIGWFAWHLAQSMKSSFGPTQGEIACARDFCEFLDTADTPAGALQKAWGNPFPEQVDAGGHAIFTMQTFEAVILAHGAYAMSLQAGLPTPRWVMKVLSAIYGPDTKVPLMPYYGGKGPWKFLNTADSNGVLQELENGVGVSAQAQGDATHAEAACALAHHITKDPVWLDRGALYNTTYSTWQQKRDALMAPGATMIDWQAGLLAQMQTA